MKTKQNKTDQSVIGNDLKGKHIFLSGVTGYLGKVLLAKIIENIYDIGSISVLIRAASKKEARARFENQVMTASIFEHFRTQMPEKFYDFCKNKVYVVCGDLTQKDLGLSPIEFNELANRIELIIHGAATVKFHEELEKSLLANTLCMYSLAKLVKKSGWSPMVHVSTCFVNGFNAGVIEEKHINPVGKIPKGLVSKNEDGSYEVDALIDHIKEKIEKAKARTNDPKQLSRAMVKLGVQTSRKYGWNDAYTLTKWLGEQLICKMLKGRSLSIVRPSVIGSTYREPVKGWIEGIKVTDVLIMGYVLGKLKIFPGKKNAVLDIIPGDLVANSVLVALSHSIHHPNTHKIYQCSSGYSNPITLSQATDCFLTALTNEQKDIFDLVQKPAITKPPIWTYRFPMINLLRLKRFNNYLKNKIAALRGEKYVAKMERTNRRIENQWNTMDVFGFYTRPTYIFCNKELTDTHAKLNALDQKLFPVNPKGMDWKKYLNNHIYGLKTFVIKESIKQNEQKAAVAEKKEIKMAS